nr:LysM domain-containing protein [Haliscomenobacter sp.]
MLPNPAYNSANIQPVNPVYAPETNTSNLGNTLQNQGYKTHIVKKGETLYRISQLYSVGIEDIKTWNYLNSDLISTGMNLSIGAPAPYTSNAVPAQYEQLSPRAPGWLSGPEPYLLSR